MGETPEARMTSYIKRIATGPEMSKDISREEARDGMQLILQGQVSDIQAGVFLVALRMKRETDDENRGVLEALRDATLFANAPVPELADIADPYDGFKRHPPTSPFLLPILAACGLPAISHGCASVGPKFGLTHRQIFAKAGVPIDLTPQEAAARLANPRVGWAYIDQSIACPRLHRLTELRRLIVKRPCIATLEKLCGPVRAEQKNHLFIGYVHHGYETQIPMVARHAGFASCVNIKGIEGGVLLPMNKTITAYGYTEGYDPCEGKEAGSFCFDPTEAGISTALRSMPIPPACQGGIDALAALSAQVGVEALSGVIGPARDSLVFTASAFLYAIGRFSSLHDAARVVCQKIDSGAALAHFHKGQ